MNENEVGLAQQSLQKQDLPSIDQLVQMLSQGMEPEELIQRGIPPEMIQAAIQVLIQQMQQQQPANQEGGLAAMSTARSGL